MADERIRTPGRYRSGGVMIFFKVLLIALQPACCNLLNCTHKLPELNSRFFCNSLKLAFFFIACQIVQNQKPDMLMNDFIPSGQINPPYLFGSQNILQPRKSVTRGRGMEMRAEMVLKMSTPAPVMRNQYPMIK
jgi:hypothetical protein